MASVQLSVGFCYTSVVMLMISTSPGDCQEVGPRNISRMEGERDVFISCPFSGQYLPAWEINGRVYELFQLPDVFIPASRGLLVPVVDVSLNGTMFRCIYPTGNGFHTKESSIGVLTVTPSRYSWVTQAPPISPQFIYIDHQHTLFEEDSKMIAIKRPTPDPSCNNYYIQSKTGCEDESEIINAWPIDSTSTTIKSTDLVKRNSQDLAYFNISSEDSLHNLCERMQTNFQIKQQVVTKNLNASRTRSKTVTIPTETEETVNIILPLPNSQSFDCACPITFFNGQCTNLKTCSCINETVFNTSVNICNTTDGLQLKFENLTEAMNGSRIFFYQSRNCDGNPSYSKYIASYEILEVLPEEPAVDVHLNVSEVCVHLRDDGISTDNYEINIYDITGEQTFHGKYIVSNISSPCSSVGNAFSHESCQPFVVSVKANNAYGSSYQNHSITSTKEGEVCSCLEKNVKAAASIKRDNGQITATIFCSDLKYKSTVLFDVILEEENDTIAVGCESVNSTQLVIFDRVDCRMNYNISLVWVAPSEIGSMGTECIIDEKNDIQVLCSMGNQSIKKDIIIGSTVGGVILVILLISIVLCCICCCKWFHHKKRESYEEISGTKSLNHQ